MWVVLNPIKFKLVKILSLKMSSIFWFCAEKEKLNTTLELRLTTTHESTLFFKLVCEYRLKVKIKHPMYI